MALQMSIGNDVPGELLPKEVSSQIWEDAQEASAVMRFASRVNLPAAGLEIPIVTSDADASWTHETDEIATDTSSFSHKAMQGYKLGVIETFSNEFRRDVPALFAALRRRLPNSIARKFDATVFHATAAPGSNFDLLSGAQALPLTSASAYDDIVDIDTAVSEANGSLSAYVFSPKARGVLLRAKDADERPLMVNNVQTDGAITSLLGVDALRSDHVFKAGTAESAPDAGDGVPEVIGFAGDWSKAFYGVVQDIRVEVSDQATVNDGTRQVNLFQRDMFAVKVTAHLGFIVRDAKYFVKVTGAVPTA